MPRFTLAAQIDLYILMFGGGFLLKVYFGLVSTIRRHAVSISHFSMELLEPCIVTLHYVKFIFSFERILLSFRRFVDVVVTLFNLAERNGLIWVERLELTLIIEQRNSLRLSLDSRL
jgi:hypothetical protein